MGRWLTEAEKRIVLVRLVLQSGASTIHVIQSQLGWEMLKFHGKSLLAEEKSVFVSLYADDSDSAGQNYARYYLASTLPYLSGIICDSAYYPKELRRRYGVGSDQIFTAYFPATGIGKQKYFSSEKGKVLWASRITQRKRPDLLLKIAKAMPDVNFHVRGHAETREEKQIAKKISKLSNVTFTGSYDFGGLVEEGDEFSLFLYTSATDGMPNVLLEATVAGLPIVASAVGGVPELINEETGYPVDKNAPPEVYISTIRRALENPRERQERWNKARDLVQKRHTHERFFQQMIGVNGYFPITHIEDSPKVSALA
jgi:glycosyltransferase involved in cell wall biosynthesis